MNGNSNTRDVSAHILPTSATMIGVCITVITIVRLLQADKAATTAMDDVVAIDGTFFLVAAICSYLSVRSQQHSQRLERWADIVFMLGLMLMVIVSFMLAWELG
jgi:hypothetical protein